MNCASARALLTLCDGKPLDEASYFLYTLIMKNTFNSTPAPAEQSVLGSLMRFPEQFNAVAALISADDFSTPTHALLFRAMSEQVRSGRPIDPISLVDVLGEKVDLGYVMELAEKSYARQALVDHAMIVRNHSVRRGLVSYGEEISSAVAQENDVEEVIARAQKGLTIVSSRLQNGKSGLSYGEMMPRYLGLLKERALKEDGITGLATGFRGLDAMTAGLQPEDFVVLGGRPSMGKTSLAMNILENVALQGNRCMVFSMEMPGESLLQRSFASIGRIDQNSLKRGQLTANEMDRLEQATRTLTQLDILIDDTPALSIAALSARAHEAHRVKPLKLLVVDYLQLMQVSGGTNRTEGISEISRGLKTLTKELKCPVIALSQLNRSLEQRPNKRPVNSDLRDSGAIEQDGDIIVFVYRDEVYEPESPDKGWAEMIVTKNRNGPIGTAKTRFIGKYTRFEDEDMRDMYEVAISEVHSANAPRQPLLIERDDDDLELDGDELEFDFNGGCEIERIVIDDGRIPNSAHIPF